MRRNVCHNFDILLFPKMWRAIEKYVTQSETCYGRKGSQYYAGPLRTSLQSSELFKETSMVDINLRPEPPRKSSSWTSRPLKMKCDPTKLRELLTKWRNVIFQRKRFLKHRAVKVAKKKEREREGGGTWRSLSALLINRSIPNHWSNGRNLC
jgi:hypothetical protein